MVTIGLLVGPEYGPFIPQRFAEKRSMESWHVPQDHAKILRTGPKHRDYYTVWALVLAEAYMTVPDGAEVAAGRWTLYVAHDGLFGQLDPKVLKE